MGVGEEDAIVSARLSKGEGEVLLVSALGQSIRFKEEEVRAMGAAATGVQGIKLVGLGDTVVALDIVEPKSEALLISDLGLGKRVPIKDFPTQGRYGIGTVAMSLKGKSRLVSMLIAAPDAKFVLVTVKGGGRVARLDEAPKRGRTARGGPVVALKPGDAVERLAAMVARPEIVVPEPPKPKTKRPKVVRAVVKGKKRPAKTPVKASGGKAKRKPQTVR